MDKMKLTRAEFKDALQKGQGRALRHLRRYGDEGLRELLLEACLHDHTYLLAIEGDRGDWMMDCIEATSNPDVYFEPVLEAFLAQDKAQDFVQHVYIVGCLVRLEKASKDVLYQKYDLQQQDEWNMHCLGKLLIEFDGIKGLLHAANSTGRRVLADSTYREENWLIECACEEHDQTEVLNALHHEAERNPNVKVYIDRVLDVSGKLVGNKEYTYSPEETISLADFLAHMEALAPDCEWVVSNIAICRFARQATEEEWRALMDIMLQETREKQLLWYLECFYRREMPRLDERVFRLAESEDKQIRHAVIQALLPFRHDDVRALALRMLDAGSLEGVALFVRNFRAGDYALILPYLKASEDRQAMFCLCSDIWDVCIAHKSADALGCLLFAYEHTPYSDGRERVVGLLMEMDLLPREIAQECRYDCNHDLRKKAVEYLDKLEKLTRAEFKDAFRKGKGRALKYMRRYGDEGLRELLLEGCLSNIGYDKQMEQRGEWMLQMIRATSEPDYYFNAVMAAYPETISWHDTGQQTDIIEGLASSGNALAKTLLYKKYDLQQLDVWEMQHIGKTLVALDGISGLLHAANSTGRRVLADPEHGEANWLISYACEEHDQTEVLNALHHEAERNPNVKAYIDRVLDVSGKLVGQTEATPQPTEKMSLADFLAQVEALEPDCKLSVLRGVSFRFGREATEEEIHSLLEAILRETRKERLLRYLWCFSRREMPRLEERLFSLAESEDKQVRDAAIHALARVPHDNVRALALRMLDAGNLEGLELFKHNFRAGDCETILARLPIPADDEGAHNVCSDLLEVCESNQAPEALGCLMWIYEHTPCSACRGYAVNGLIALNILPRAVAEECRYDCNEDIRHEVAEYLKTTDLH